MRELIGETGEFLILRDGICVPVIAEQIVFAVPFNFDGIDVYSLDSQDIAFPLV